MLAAPLTPDTDVTGAEVLHAVRHELALTLEDIVIRRTALGAAGHPGEAVVRACAAIAAGPLGWSADRVEDEVSGVARFYQIGRQVSTNQDQPAGIREV